MESIYDKLLETDKDLVNRWILPKPINEDDITNINLNHTLQAVLIRRGIDLNNEFDEYITPSDLPNPEEHFDELSKATQRIIKACLKKEKIAVLNLDKIQNLLQTKKINKESQIDLDALKKSKIISKSYNKIKILGSGEIKEKINLNVDFISKSAKEKLEKVGGTIRLKQKD